MGAPTARHDHHHAAAEPLHALARPDDRRARPPASPVARTPRSRPSTRATEISSVPLDKLPLTLVSQPSATQDFAPAVTGIAKTYASRDCIREEWCARPSAYSGLLPNLAVLQIKSGACGAAGRASAPGSAMGGPPLTNQAHSGMQPASLVTIYCPAPVISLRSGSHPGWALRAADIMSSR